MERRTYEDPEEDSHGEEEEEKGTATTVPIRLLLWGRLGLFLLVGRDGEGDGLLLRLLVVGFVNRGVHYCVASLYDEHQFLVLLLLLFTKEGEAIVVIVGRVRAAGGEVHHPVVPRRLVVVH